MKREFAFWIAVTALVGFTFAGPAFAQQRWTKTYGGISDDQGYSVQQTTDGGYIVAGQTASFGAGYEDVYLIKTNASGDTLWTRTYGGTDYDYGTSVRQTSDSGYIIAGYTKSFGAGNYDIYLIKTNASGDTLWTRTYGGASGEEGNSVQQTSDGGYIVTGWTTSFGAGGWDVYLIKTDALGNTSWTKTYGGTTDELGYSVQQTTDGGYIITGWTASFGAGSGDVWLIKTNSIGDTLWTRTYGGATWDEGSSVQQTSDGGYIIAGWTDSFGAGFYDVYLIKTNASGDTLWTRTYGGLDNDLGQSVQQTSDGGYIVGGYTSSFQLGSQEFYLIKTNASGDTLWTKGYDGINTDEGYSVQQTSDGGYIFAGTTSSYGAGAYDIWLIKTDGNGNVGVEGQEGRRQKAEGRITAQPNPFTSFARVPGHEGERFSMYDVSGRKMGTYKGDRIGEGLLPGVYFLKPDIRPSGSGPQILRLVKVR